MITEQSIAAQSQAAPPCAFQIPGWGDTFENSKSRTIDRCGWVPMPTKQHGDGLASILNEPDGVSIFGFWVLIVEACAQHSRPRDGWLTNTGRQDGKPWTAKSLANRWRRSEQELQRALDFLTSDAIGWLARYPAGVRPVSAQCHLSVTEIPPQYPVNGTVVSPECHRGVVELNGIELNGKNQEGGDAASGGEKPKAKKAADPLPSIPTVLDTPEFRAAWGRWCQHRREIKKPLKPTSVASQFDVFEKWGVDYSIAAINHTILKGWEGLREPDAPRSHVNGNGQHNGPATRSVPASSTPVFLGER